MLSRSLRTNFSSLAKDLNTRMAEVQSRLSKSLPASLLSDSPFSVPEESRQKTMDEKLAELDSKIAKIEGLREAGKPEEIRIKNLDMKYGRAGRHPAYPWYGEAVPHEDRLPHLADRLGKYSEMGTLNTELNDWLQMKNDLNNPVFHSYFVQEPSQQPDPDVNFEKGEVIYENPYAFQGTVLAKQTGFVSAAYVAFYMAHTVFSGRTVYPIATEALDHRTDSRASWATSYVNNVYQNYGDWHDVETFSSVSFIAPLAPLAAVSLVLFIKSLTDGAAIKMQFNKNKDLVFVTKVKGVFFPKLVEEVYETTHLQVLPPSVGTGFWNVSEREVFTISCMNSHESFRVCSSKKYWNPEHFSSFHKHLYGLWG